MKSFYILIGFPWLSIPYFINQIIGFQAKLIGGSKYFSHVGIAPAVTVECGLAVVAVLICMLLWGAVCAERAFPKLRAVVRGLSIVFVVVTAYVYLPLLIPPLGRFAFLSLAGFPPKLGWFPASAVMLGIVTGLSCGTERSKVRSAA